MREYSSPLTIELPAGGNLTDDVTARATTSPDAVAFSVRTATGWTDVTAAEFHERLRSQAALPTTSQPTPQAFLDTFSLAFEEGEAVVGVIVGSTLSGTLGSAEAAAALSFACAIVVAQRTKTNERMRQVMAVLMAWHVPVCAGAATTVARRR